MSRLRVGLLGCGGIAARHAAAVAALGEEMELVAGCGRDVERTGAFARERGIEPFVDFERMLGEARLDLLIATLPPYCRSGEIEQAAAGGVNLLVEKPIALDEAPASRMVEAVERSGVVAAIGFMYRFGDAVRRWRSIETGRIGLYAGSYHCNALHAHWWRRQEQSGGQIVEQVIHQIDLIRHLMGEPDTVYARRFNLFHREVEGYDVEDVSAIVFGWDDGRIAALNASNIAVPGLWHKDWAIFAERMTGRFASWNEAVLTPTIAGAESEIVAGTSDPFTVQLADVAAAIREKRAPYVPLREGAATLSLALSARQSAEQGREIRLAGGD